MISTDTTDNKENIMEQVRVELLRPELIEKLVSGDGFSRWQTAEDEADQPWNRPDRAESNAIKRDDVRSLVLVGGPVAP